MAEDDHHVRYAESARGLDIFEVAPAQEFCAHQADKRDPGKQQQYPKQDEESRHQHRGNDQQQIKRGNRRPDFDEALEQKIGPSAEITLNGAGGDTDDRGNDGQRQSEQYRYPESVDQPRYHIAATIVSAKPVRFDLVAFGKPVGRGKLAILFRQKPCWLGGKRRWRPAHLRVVVEAYRWPDDDAAFILDETHQVVVTIVGCRAEEVGILLLGKGRVRIRDD